MVNYISNCIFIYFPMLFYKRNTYINSSLQHSDLVGVSHGKTRALIGDQKEFMKWAFTPMSSN